MQPEGTRDAGLETHVSVINQMLKKHESRYISVRGRLQVFVSGVAGCPSTLQSVLLELVVLCCLSV
jgi:hypothetical protein